MAVYSSSSRERMVVKQLCMVQTGIEDEDVMVVKHFGLSGAKPVPLNFRIFEGMELVRSIHEPRLLRKMQCYTNVSPMECHPSSPRG